MGSYRRSLPCASIMIRQPMQRVTQMQASDIDIYRKQIRKTTAEIVQILSKHTGHTKTKIAEDILRPKYFEPKEALEYGIIDKVIDEDRKKSEITTRAKKYSTTAYSSTNRT